MYLRFTQRRNKNGDVVRYVALAHNERNERGVPVARIIHTFGREDEVDRAALARLVASISRFLEPEQALAAGAPAGFDFIEAREQGRPHVVQALWQELGIGRALGRVARSRRYRRDVERWVFAMVAQRCIAPASKLEATRWATREVVLAGVGELSDDGLYSAMDFLLECSERVQEAVFFSVANLLNSEVDVVFFDTTSTYFEVELDDDEAGLEDDDEDDAASGEMPLAEAGLRRLGHSKDDRPDRPQVVIGLAVTREGIPVRVWVWPGNTNDQTVIESVKDDLGGWKLGRCVWVIDSGFSSTENLRYLKRAGGHYIAGMKLRSGTAEAKLALKRQGRYHVVADNIAVKQVIVGDGAARRRFVVARNPREADRDRQRREQTIARLQARLAELEQTRGAAHEKAACKLRAHRSMGRYLRQTKTGRLMIDRAKIRDEARLDGKYLITTSDDTLTPEDVALGYKNLLEAERGFWDLKGTLLLRPVFHRKEDRIRAHVLICFLALVVIRVAELRAADTWRTIGDELGTIKLGHFRAPDGEFTQRTELTTDQRHLLKALGVPEPPRFGHITPSAAPTA
ncbi:MAG: IS1634 family transposase [Actinomycetota bacterium]|nr:IS1634 family transposase [Actinomycetota bacterium]